MIILGVDTSLRSTGYGVLAVEGNKMQALDYGNIKNAAKLPLSSCVSEIYKKLTELIAQYHPEVIAVEKVIYAKNAGTMLILGQARGAVLVAGSQYDIPIYEYEPRRAKIAVCGNGLAEKEQVQRMIKVLLNLPELPQNDAADALAMAISHVHANSVINKEQPI